MRNVAMKTPLSLGTSGERLQSIEGRLVWIKLFGLVGIVLREAGIRAKHNSKYEQENGPLHKWKHPFVSDQVGRNASIPRGNRPYNTRATASLRIDSELKLQI